MTPEEHEAFKAKEQFNKELFSAILDFTTEGMEVSFRPQGTSPYAREDVDIQITAMTKKGEPVNKYFCNLGVHSLDMIPKILQELKQEIENQKDYPEKASERWVARFKTLTAQRALEEENSQLRYYKENCGVEKELAEKVAAAVHKIVFDYIKSQGQDDW